MLNAIDNALCLAQHMPAKEVKKLVTVFVDGYNFQKASDRNCGKSVARINFRRLGLLICRRHPGWELGAVRYYAGIPTQRQNAKQHEVWQRRFKELRIDGIEVISRRLHLRNGILREKGIDTRIAIDIMRLAYEGSFNVALLLSQDQDFAEIAREMQSLRSSGLPVELACAFPTPERDSSQRGVTGARWEKILAEDIQRCSENEARQN